MALRGGIVFILGMVGLLGGCGTGARDVGKTPENTPQACSDGLDNDRDGNVDCTQASCFGTYVCAAKFNYVTDDWGDVWGYLKFDKDKVVLDTQEQTNNYRGVQGYDVAEKACANLSGARLPTATEVYRLRSSVKTTDDKGYTIKPYDPIWTLIKARIDDTTQEIGRIVVDVSTATPSVAVSKVTDPKSFRCIWPQRAAGSGFDEARCNGKPGSSRCANVDELHAMDAEDRAPLTYMSAVDECAFNAASVPRVNDFENLLQTGNVGVPPAANLWASNAVSDTGLATFMWGPGTRSTATAGVTTPTPFRCIGVRDQRRVMLPGASCNGGCLTAWQRQSPLIADNADRAPASFSQALAQCRAQGADLPDQAEMAELVRLNWKYEAPPGQTVDPPVVPDIWLADPVGASHAIGRRNGAFPNFGAAAEASTSVKPYRCVWHPRGASLPVCRTGQSIVKKYGYLMCQDDKPAEAPSRANGGVAPAFDDWNNAWDSKERGPRSYAKAEETCTKLGGRLPFASELFAVRYGGPAYFAIGGVNDGSALWTKTSGAKPGTQLTLTLSEGKAVSQVLAEADVVVIKPFRCIWPEQRGTVLSGRNCFGQSCFTAVPETIADSEDRAEVPYVSAVAECANMGGRLPELRELQSLVNARWPNGSGRWLWTTDVGVGTKVLAKWTGAGTDKWEFDGSATAEATGIMKPETESYAFRCIYRTAVR